MSNSFFSFKQFTVHQERSAMKVGTDGVLLGAWADLRGVDVAVTTAEERAAKVLDVGCGTGLLALMAAQRSPLAHVDAVEIDAECCRDAADNFAASPWSARLNLHHLSAQEYAACAVERYDHIISNPPYFLESLLSPSESRAKARHAVCLTQGDLMGIVDRLLKPQGSFSLILPINVAESFLKVAACVNFHLRRRTWVYPLPDVDAKRVLLQLERGEGELREDRLVIESEGRHAYSVQYVDLTCDFYLKF